MTTNRIHLSGERRRGARWVAATVTVLAGGVLLAVAPSAAAAASTAPCSVSAQADWKVAAARAGTALTAAQVAVSDGDDEEATHQLRVLKRKLRNANVAAAALIGQPPTDPESDEPPGPSAVLRVSRLDHKVTVAMVSLLDDPGAQQLSGQLGTALNRASSCRDTMLAAVISARRVVRDDYTDGLSDTLPDYDQELDAMTAALASGGLTTDGRGAVELAQQVVTTTRDAMQAAFGGGERAVP